MALINNSIESLYNGVSEQSAEHRQQTQVKSMVNAYPTIDKGLLKRNPTQRLPLGASVTYTDDMFIYEYDRGLSGDSEEKYAININDQGIEIINVLNGDVYNENAGLTYEGTAKDYLFPFGGKSGYAATTVKDTTFITNRGVTPKMVDINADVGTAITVYEARVQMALQSVQTKAPHYNTSVAKFGMPSYADGYTTFIVDGTVVKISSIHNIRKTSKEGAYPITWTGEQTYATYISNVVNALESTLDRDIYSVNFTNDGILRIKRKDETAVTVSYDIDFIEKDGTAHAGTISDWITSVDYINYPDIITAQNPTFLTEAYIWVKNSNSAAAYTYHVSVTDSLLNTVTTSQTATTTEAAATALAGAIDANANFSATATNSVVKITATATGAIIKAIDGGDSYGNQASFVWSHKVQYTTDLPKSLGFANAIVNVIGSGDSQFVSYWLKYEDGQWIETLDPREDAVLDTARMPHVLVRNGDDTFTLKEYDGWKNRLVGDAESNKEPSFISSAENGSPKIVDVFFFKNRLGFITERTVIMSEVGGYGNFWRTTVATVLDSDPIDTTVDTTKAIKLQYATYLEDSVMLFSDKTQFKLEGGQVLSPSSVQISQTSAYEINTNIRPIYMNDKIFFCVKRGVSTAVMQYQVKKGSAASEALDITAHVQTYIPENVTRLTGSSVNNMLFLTTDNSSSMFVYKYYDSGDSRVQSAWFEWDFNGIVYNAFSLGRYLNIMINRNDSVEATDWVLGTGIWESDKVWDSNAVWYSEPADLVSTDQFEIMPIAPIEYSEAVFLDDVGSDNETIINTIVNIGEWIPEFSQKKDIRGQLQFKTFQISSEENSQFELMIADLKRGDTRIIDAKYTVDRKPMVYGNAKNLEIGIRNRSNIGFRINSINYEGNYNTRSTKK